MGFDVVQTATQVRGCTEQPQSAYTRHDDMREFLSTVEDLSPEEANALFAQLSDADLKAIEADVNANGVGGTEGLDGDEKHRLFAHLSAKLDLPQLQRVATAFDNLEDRVALVEEVKLRFPARAEALEQFLAQPGTRPPVVRKDTGMLTRYGAYQQDGQLYDTKTHAKVKSPFSPGQLDKSRQSNASKQVNSVSVDMVLFDHTASDPLGPSIELGARSETGEVTGVVGVRHESIQRASLRVRAFSATDPAKDGQGKPPDTLDAFLELYQKEALVYASASGKQRLGPVRTSANLNLSSTEQVVVEAGLRPSHLYGGVGVSAEATLLKVHVDADLTIPTPLGDLTFGPNADYNFGSVGVFLGGGLARPSGGGVKAYWEAGASLGMGARISYAVSFKPDMEGVKKVTDEAVALIEEGSADIIAAAEEFFEGSGDVIADVAREIFGPRPAHASDVKPDTAPPGPTASR